MVCRNAQCQHLILATGQFVNLFFVSTLELKRLENDQQNEGECKECSLHSEYRCTVHSLRLYNTNIHDNKLQEIPHVKNSCYANKSVTGSPPDCRVNCSVRSLRHISSMINSLRPQIEVSFLRVTYRQRSLKKKKAFVSSRVFLLLSSLVSTGAPQYIWIW